MHNLKEELEIAERFCIEQATKIIKMYTAAALAQLAIAITMIFSILNAGGSVFGLKLAVAILCIDLIMCIEFISTMHSMHFADRVPMQKVDTRLAALKYLLLLSTGIIANEIIFLPN